MTFLRFLFAINTIAMVKDQSLFSYVAPGNIFAWILNPLRYFVPLRHFVWLNRTIIKITHFPLLFAIFLYEKYILSPSMFEPTDFVDNPGIGRARAFSINPSGRSALFSPTIRIREESVAGFQQDRALEEVFRRTPASLRAHKMDERKRTQKAIRNWMDRNETIPESPNNYSTIDSRTQRDWSRKLSLNKERPPQRFRHMSEVRSIVSDPAELVSNSGFALDGAFGTIDRRGHTERTILKDQDADDELVTNDDDEDEATAPSRFSRSRSRAEEEEDYFTTPVASRFNNNHLISTSFGSSSRSPAHQQGPSLAKRLNMHSRTMSTNTILYNPPKSGRLPPRDEEISPGPATKNRSRPMSTRQTPSGSPVHRSPRRNMNFGSRPRPIVPPRETMHTAPNINRFGPGLAINQPGRRPGNTRRMSSSDLLDIQSDLAGVNADDAFGAVPSSFVTQMAMATGMITPGGHRVHDKARRERDNDRDRMGRLVLARMKTLEEGFADVVKEMKTLQRSSGVSTTTHSSASDGPESAVWKGDDRDDAAPFTTAGAAGRDRGAGGGRRSQTYKASTSRPDSQKGGDKSNRNSVILRSPIGLENMGAKGKEKVVEKRRVDASESEADESGDEGDVDPVGVGFTKGSSL